MTKRTRRNHSGAFKAKVALAARKRDAKTVCTNGVKEGKVVYTK